MTNLSQHQPVRARLRRPDDPVQALLDRLDGVVSSGGGWLALCPAHGDRRPSLSVRRGADGRALVHCFAGCTVGEIVGAVGLSLAHLFPRMSSPSTAPVAKPEKPYYRPLSWGAQKRLYRAQQALRDDRDVLRRLRDEKGVAAWAAEAAGLGVDPARGTIEIPYLLGDGHTLAAVDHWRFRADRDGGPPAIASAGHPRPLYVPHLVLAELVNVDTLIVTEGPMDALTACSRGHAAVAAASASTWKRDNAGVIASLEPEKVVVCGDCDSAGRRFAHRAASDLEAHGVDVLVLDLDPERHDGYDLGAHLLAGGRLP